MLITFLWMALAASGGVLSGILFDKLAPGPEPTVPVNTGGSFDFFKTVKLIGILTVGAFAVHLIIKMFGIKIFNRVKH